MNKEFHIVIPARYQSSRLPGKLLMDLKGMSVLERVYRQAELANPESIIIAADSHEIYEHAKTFGANVVMTANTHQSGTDRIAEAITLAGFSSDAIVVNVQGDEPLISPLLIQQVAALLDSDESTPMATLCWPIETLEDAQNPNIVKVVRNKHDHAIYFSRSHIPANRDNPNHFNNTFRHIGLYAYRATFLQEFVSWPVCELESQEALEQLRVIFAGYSIKVALACVEPLQDINTIEDLDMAQKWLLKESIQ